MSDLPKVPPRTREDLIASELSDEDIIVLIHHLKARVEKYGDVQAAKIRRTKICAAATSK